MVKDLDGLAKLESNYPKRTPESVADALLQGWAFTGQSREDHDREKEELVARIRKIRNDTN